MLILTTMNIYNSILATYSKTQKNVAAFFSDNRTAAANEHVHSVWAQAAHKMGSETRSLSSYSRPSNV